MIGLSPGSLRRSSGDGGFARTAELWTKVASHRRSKVVPTMVTATRTIARSPNHRKNTFRREMRSMSCLPRTVFHKRNGQEVGGDGDRLRRTWRHRLGRK